MFTSPKKIAHVFAPDIVPDSFYYQPSIFDELLITEDGTRMSDISFLFNQQRLDKVISKENFDAYFSKLLQQLPSNPFAGMSDDALIDMVKDRRISSFNDLYNYSRYLIANKQDASEYMEDVKRHDADKARIEKLRKSLDNVDKDDSE